MIPTRFIEGVTRRLQAIDRFASHSLKVSSDASQIADALGLPPEDIPQIAVGALLHDIGKTDPADEEIYKIPGKLTTDQYERAKRHPLVGLEILARNRVRVTSIEKECIVSHHERFDGRGYPVKLKGLEIPLGAAAISVADAADAMTAQRLYNIPITLGDTLAIIEQNSGTQFNPQAAKIYVQMNYAGLLLPPEKNWGRLSSLLETGGIDPRSLEDYV